MILRFATLSLLTPFALRASTSLSPPLCAARMSSSLSAYSVGKPSYAIVPPGVNQFEDEFRAVPLLSVAQISPDTKVFTFATPDPSLPLNLCTCGCMLAAGGADSDGKPFVRPYTPVSTNAKVGAFDLMVKIYPEGNLSQHLDKMKVGDELSFKHIPFNVKRQYPFEKKNIAMIAGGTGIAPMIQALHALLGNPDDETSVTLLYGSQRSDQILASEVLGEWAESHGDRLKVVNVLSAEPEGTGWTGQKGFINKELITKHFPGPAEDVEIFVCGPPPMYDALCGARGEEELSGVLKEIGYSKEQVTKF